MNKVIDKLFYDDAYGLAIRKLDSADSIFYTRYPDDNYWYADPFVCHEDEKTYVFVEAMEYYKGLGRIAVAEVIGNTIGDFKIVIEEPFHLSFPNVFQYEEEWYMIPESCASRQMRLYKAKHFPYQWEFVCTLLDGVNFVDTVFHFVDEHTAIGMSYDLDTNSGKPIKLNMQEMAMKCIELEGNYSLERPGGEIHQKGNGLYRVVQDCVRCYGDFLHLFSINKISNEKFDEIKVGELHAPDIVFDDGLRKEYIHTYNTDGVYEVIDFRYRKHYPLKAYARLMWKFYIK